MATIDVCEFIKVLNLQLDPIGLEAIPFNVRWYNELRLRVAGNRPQLITTDNPDSLGIVVISNRNFFKEVVKISDPFSAGSDFVDSTVDYHLKKILNFFNPEMIVTSCNTDRPPYYHVQSIGYVAGIDEYVDSTLVPLLTEGVHTYVSHRDEHIWGSVKNKLLSVNIHPRYGGWYAYRMLFVVHSVTYESKTSPPPPLHFLSDEEKKIVIREYNEYPNIGRWRDFHDSSQGPILRYETHQYLFFHEISTDKRRRILQLLKEETLVA